VGIQTHTTLLRKERKGGNLVQRGQNWEESREKEKNSPEKGSGYTSLMK
jgi:hypothetical protein